MSAQSAFKDTSVLVTGASGFIGTHLCRGLSRFGARVAGVYFRHLPHGSDADWIAADLTNLETTREVFRSVRPSYVFHLASLVLGRRELNAVVPTFQNNLATSVNVMTAAQEAGGCRRLVIANSMEEPSPDAPEEVPCSPYAASKFGTTAYARMFHALYGLPTVMARVFMVYGPEQKDHTKLIPYTILRALDGKSPELSSGIRKVDWIYVSDVVDGLLRLGCTPGIEGQTIDLGSGQLHSIRSVVEEILHQTEANVEGRFGAITDRAMEQERVASASRSKAILGWQAKVELKEGLAQTITWYREHREKLVPEK